MSPTRHLRPAGKRRSIGSKVALRLTGVLAAVLAAVSVGLLVAGAQAAESVGTVTLGGSELCFSSASYGTGAEPVPVLAADLNGDEFRDLVVTNTASYTLSVRLNTGDGTFGSATNLSLPAGFYSEGLALGDLDLNGTADLVATGHGATNSQVWVFLGNGNGTFQTTVNYPVGNRFPHDVVIGRYDAGATPDLAVANYGPDFQGGTVSILLGRGDGSYQPARDFPAGVNPVGINQGDFNRDGRLDLAVPNNNYPFGISILLGNGDGSFGSPVLYPLVGINPRGPAVGDFNSDGNLDLGVGTYQFPSGVSVLLGNGDGTFKAAVNYSAGQNLGDVATADMNDDDFLDLVTANYGSTTVSILLGRGDGTFIPPQDLDVGRNPVHVALEDLNSDGRIDVAVTNYSDNTVAVLLGIGCSIPDTTPPVLTVPADITVNATSPAGAVVTFTATATDENPAHPTVTCTPPSASVFTIGDTQVECSATDTAGLTATKSFTVHVKGAPEQVADLLVLVDSYKLGQLGTALHEKLVNVQGFLTANKPARACNVLDRFLAQVKEQRGKRISIERADRLTADAQRIKDVIGC